jgi:hypothetical protein
LGANHLEEPLEEVAVDINSITIKEAERILRTRPNSEEAKAIRQAFEETARLLREAAPLMKLAFLEAVYQHDSKKSKKGGNPLFVWEAINFCIENYIQFPAWIMQYLDDSASELARLQYMNPNKDFNHEIAKALGFRFSGGSGNLLFKFKKEMLEIDTVCEIMRRREERRGKKGEQKFLEIICMEIANELEVETGKEFSYERLMAWHRKWRPFLNSSVK